MDGKAEGVYPDCGDNAEGKVQHPQAAHGAGQQHASSQCDGAKGQHLFRAKLVRPPAYQGRGQSVDQDTNRGRQRGIATRPAELAK